MGELQDLVERFYAAFNRNDLDAAMTCFRPDVLHQDPAQGEMRGADAWRAYGETFKAAAPDATLELRTATECGDRIAVEGTFRGTFTGPLPTPQGEAPPTGNRFALDFVDVFEVRSGQFSAQRVYYDQMALMSQLGLMPEGAAAG